jgi:hypothetical protein
MLTMMYILWVLYLAVMCLKGARDAGRLSKPVYYLSLPILSLGYFLDFLVNMFVMTFIMLELPREFLVTSRVIRHKYQGAGYRKKVATWICDNLLDPFDPSGCHCKE